MGLPEVVALLRAEIPGLRSIHLFGSATTGRMRPDSDIDLAVDAGDGLPAALRLDLADRCGVLLGRDVDLADLRDLPLSLQARVVTEGRKLYDAAPVTTAFRDNLILSRHCALNEERRPLFETIRQRGSVHA